MQSVSDKYYYWYNWAVTSLGLLLTVASIVALTMPTGILNPENGFIAITAIIGFVQIIYGLIFFRLRAKTSPWIAALISAMLLTLNVISLMQDTGQLHSQYWVLWAIQAFFSGLFGVYVVAAIGFLMTLYFVLVATGEAGTQQLDIITVGAVVGTYLIGAIGYLIWRNLYIDHETKRVQKLTGQLKTNQQQAEMLIQSISDGLVVITPEGKISLINPAAARLTGWEVDEAIGLDVQLVVKLLEEDNKPINDTGNPLKAIFGQLETISADKLLVKRDGKSIVVSIVVSPVILPKTKTVSGAVAIIRDISVSRAEEKRRADFISTASHEMRTPVAAIEGYLALALNDKVSSIDSKARGFLEKAHSSTQHLGKLFQDLLTSARAEDGRLVSHPVVVEMGSYLEQLTDSLRFTAEKKGLMMDFVIGSEEHVTAGSKVIKPLYYVHVDPDRIREVITNLFDNATKYTEAGKISVGLTGNNEVIQIYIKDTGAGIPADDVPHLFQKFYRVDSSATRTIGGTGLGLFICRKIIELYNGRVWVESELNKGSTFYINLPRVSSQKATELQASEAEKALTLSQPIN